MKRYSVVVDEDVKMKPKEVKTFRNQLAMYLADPDGWSQSYTFEEVDRNPDVIIHLSSPATIQSNGCKNGSLSCAQIGGHHMWLNAMRWFQGASESKLPLDEYRQYMVSHEMGHILGHDHISCSGRGQPAPVMMQQTIGIGNCKPNTKLTQRDLSQ